MPTASELFAMANGARCEGPGRCACCGTPAAEPWQPPDSFTALDGLARPGSGVRCAGCALAMTATAGQSPEGKPWMWSWVITPTRADRLALCVMLGGDRVRADRVRLRTACLTPPPAPYAIVLAMAGRTHQMYRAVVHAGGPGAALTLDGKPLRYDPADLVERIALCGRIAVAYGPKTARDRLLVSAGRWSSDVDALADLESWHELLDDPLTAVAACLFDDPLKETP